METRLLKKQMTAAYQYSYVRLILNYYTFFETMAEDTAVSARMLDCSQRLNKMLSNHFSGADVEEGLLGLRQEIIGEVEALTSFTDCFQIYEYVLNRMERKFKKLPATGFDDVSFEKRLIEFITKTSETGVMNGRIKQIVGQLPVRLTKQKFFSLVLEGLSVYIGSPKENLTDMLYTLRTESMAKLPPNMEDGHKDLYETLEEFRQSDYLNMAEDGYEVATANLMAACERLTSESGLFVMLQEIINDFCVLIFARQEAVIDVKEEEFYQSLVSEILDKFLQEDYSFPKEDFFDRLTQLEGRQEVFYERYLKAELPEESDVLNKDPGYVKAVNVDRLLSGSHFVELKKLNSENDVVIDEEKSVVDRSFLDASAGEFFKELEAVFSGTSKPVIRAVMAKVLSDIPVYFNSVDEIQAYIRGSLDSCLDEAEKETCKELLEELMDYENMLV